MRKREHMKGDTIKKKLSCAHSVILYLSHFFLFMKNVSVSVENNTSVNTF